MTRRIVLGLLLVGMFASQSFATNYYVSATSGSDSKAGTKTSPWRSISKVCSAMRAGDTAFLAGTFQPESTFTYAGQYVTLYPQYSGTEGHPIVYKNWPDSGRPKIVGYINSCCNSLSCYHRTIFNANTDYIVFDSLETYYGFRGITISSGDHVTVRNCISHHSTGGNNNNTANIYIGAGAPNDLLIENNVCHDAMEAGPSGCYIEGGWNTGGIYAEIEGWDVAGVTKETRDQSLYAHRIIIQNNTVYNQGGFGIRLKRMLDSAIVRNNIIYDCMEGISILASSGLSEYFYGNIMYDIKYDAFVATGRNDTKYVESDDILVFNNTAYNMGGSGLVIYPEPMWQAGKVFNNIFVGSNKAITNGQPASDLSSADTFYVDYNCYYSSSSWDWPDPVYSTLSAWRANTHVYLYGKDSHSITDNPAFTNTAANNFTLQSGSPAAKTFKDTTFVLWTGETLTFNQMGAYGISSSGGGVLPPRITLVSATDTTTNSVLISWSTDVPTTSRVEYGYNTGYGNLTSLTTSLINEHAVLLTSLDSSTVYHYRVISSDSGGVTAYSADYVFRTLDTIPPSPINEIFDADSKPTYGSLGTLNPKIGIVNHPPVVVREPEAFLETSRRR